MEVLVGEGGLEVGCYELFHTRIHVGLYVFLRILLQYPVISGGFFEV
jgi:hypothetical protein